MASVDKSSDAVNIDDNAAADATSSCLNDPNFAIICVFLQKFGVHLKIEHPDFLRLQKMIENTDEVHDELRQFFVRLLRKTRKSVQPDKLDSALAKFCYTYSAQDAWEIERFGYKKSSLPVKLRVLKEVLESQFDKNPNFRTLVSAQTAAELRSQPLGKDKLGNAYWSTVDGQCNLRIYQEHLDEEIWKVVATNRDEMAKLIACLRGNELVMPSLVGIIDEDSSSNSMPPKVDALQNENGNGTTNSNDSDEKNVPCLKIKLNSNGADSTVEQIANGDNTNGAKNLLQNDSIGEEEEEEDASVMSEIDELSQAASESSTTTAGTKSTETQGSKRISLMASKPPSNANKLKLRIFASDKNTLKRNLEEDSDRPSGRNKRPSMQSKNHGDDDDSEFESEELSDEEMDDISGEDDDDDEVGPAIEEPTMYVRGEGAGAENNCKNDLWPCVDESNENEVGEAIEEEVFYVFGQGNGFDCDVGNNDIKTTESPASSTTTPPPIAQSKPMFFFGQAGCLKLSPMKPALTTDNSSATSKNDTETENEKSQETLSSDVNQTENETNTNNTNSVALDAKSESVPENNTDETDKGVSAVIEPTLINAPENNIGDKIENASASNDLPPINESTTQIETDESDVAADVEPSETPTSVAVTAESESSKENIESNSSVALANISVQEKSESIEQESLTTTSETVLQTESHSSNDTNENSGISDRVEKQLSDELNVGSDDLKSVEMENQPEPEHKLSEVSSEIDVNESNALENDNENENQSSVSQVENEPRVEVEVEAKAEAPLTREDVPIENQTISSKNNEITETTESTSEQVLETEKPATPIENDSIPLVEESNEQAIVEQTEKVESSELDNNESNNDVKTEILNEQNTSKSNEDEQETSTSEEIKTRAETIEPEREVTQIAPTVVEAPVEIPIEIPIEIPVETAPELPSKLEEATEDLNETPFEQSEAVKPIETTILPDEQDKIDETLPSTPETIEQIPSQPIETPPVTAEIIKPTPIEAAPVHDEPSEPLPDEDVVKESIPSSEIEPITENDSESIPSKQIESTPNAYSSETVENVDNDNKETVSVEAVETALISVPTETERQEMPSVDSERQETPQINLEREETPEKQEIVHKPVTDKSEAIATEIASTPIIEKRKSIDQIEEVSECKKICEEKILEEPVEAEKFEVNKVVEQKINEIPTTSQDEFISKQAEIVEQSDTIEIAKVSPELETPTEPSQIETSEISEKSIAIAHDKEDASQISRETNVEICHETSKIEQPNLDEISTPKTDNTVENAIQSVEKGSTDKAGELIAENQVDKLKNEQPEIPTFEYSAAKTLIEAPVATEKAKSPSPIPATVSAPAQVTARVQPTQAQSSRVAQLRTRKRRISSEKARHSSESDDNIDALIESPLSQDASSDEEVGGKRIKMRPKVVKRSVRKSVEQKRNIKDTDWSSDDNEKPNAKRATSEVSKEMENLLPSTEKVTPEQDRRKSPIKEEILPSEKTEEVATAVEEMKVKQEEEVAEPQSDEEQATPTRRPGRPARRGRKPGPKPKSKPVEEIKTEDVKGEPAEQNESIKEEKPEPTATPTATPPKPETRRKKRSLLGLDIAEIETAQAAVDADTPVRQSRRIAQIKIREEAERRKAEEVALQKMKEASEKKKKGVVVKQSASEEEEEEEEENSESEVKLEKKKKRKKENKERPWQTDSDDSSEREEEDVYEHEDVERLPPLGSDHEFSPESDIEDESQIVPTKRARTARKDKTERREEESEEEEDIHACQKCSKSDHPEWILLCDKCDKGYHCSCLIPVLFVIPEGDWFCPPCQQEKLIDQLEVKLIEFDNMIKQKEIEEAQRQRLLMTTISAENVIKDTKRDRQRARAVDGSDNSSESSSSEEESDVEEKIGNSERRTRPRPRTNRQRNRSESESEASSSDNTSDNEPIYKLRKRRQANVSYRFNEYDELINRAIKSEMDEVAGAGNLGRGKDISTIIEADKEEKRLKKLEEQQKEREIAGENNEKDDDDSDDQPLKTKVEKSDGSDSEPIRPKAIKRSKNVGGRKKKKLNSLDVDSEEDADSSDDDFNTSSYSDDEEEEDSSPPSESSLDSIVKKKRGKGRGISTRRSVRDRKKRYDADFIDDSSFDDEDNIPLVKKKKKVESDFDDFDESSEELEEDVDSEDLCDDSTDESDRSWGKKKKKASNKVVSNKSRKKKPDSERSGKGKTAKKKLKVSDDDDDDDDDSDEEDADEVLPKSRRTRGKKLPYLLDDDFDSSDDGIKPGVKRPDTPPEERAAFIKKQEEIKRMLAEKGNDEKSVRIPPPSKDSLSTIPPQIIQTAKALDVDLKKTAILHRNASDNDSNGFDDDLPEDFDPEDMDEDAIAKMMEEEEFAQQQLKLAGETIRNRKLKDALTDPMKKDDSPTKLTIETGASVIMQSTIPSLVSPLPLSTSQLTIPDIPPSMYTAQFQGANNKQSTTPKKRGRKTKDDILPLGPKEQVLPQLPTIQHTSVLPPNKPNTPLNMPSVLQHAPTSQLFASPTIQHTSSVIAHSSVIQQQQRLPPMPQSITSSLASSILGIAQNREPIIPSTVLDVQNTRLLDPSELGKPPDDLLDPAAKKRARSRKKITPTRDSLITSPPNVTVTPGITQPSPVTIPNVPNVSKPTSSILSERLSANPADKSGLSIATPPQLYSPSSRSQASVITRLTRPSQRQPFPSGQSPPQRYYAPNASMPSHSIPATATVSHSRPYHTPNVTVASGPRPPPLVPPQHTSGHLPHPMYMRGQPGIYGGYPNIQPPPMHRSLQSIEHASNSPQNFTGAYQNLPFGSYYAAAQAAAAERRSGAIIGTFEPFDNKNPASHERLPAYAHPSLGLAALAGRNPTGEVDDDRTGPAPPSAALIGPGGVGGVGGSTSEFSGLVSYFSSQQDDLDS